MKKLYLLVLLIFIATNVFSDNLSNIQGSFLDVGYGARSMAMGGAYVAITQKANSILWNPAGLSNATGNHNISFDNVNLINLYNYSFVGYGYRLKNNHALGFGMIYSGDEAMSETTVYLSGAFNCKKYIKLKFLKKFSLGANLKYFGSSFGNNSDGSFIDGDGEHQVSGSAHGFGIDLGLQTEISIVKKRSIDQIGILWRNPINTISWESKNETGTAEGSYSEGLPSSLIIGYGMIKDRFIFSLDYEKALHKDVEDVVRTGTEFRLFGRNLALRTGYSQEIYTGDNRRYSFGLGFQVKWKKALLFLDIAYQIQSQWEGNNIFRISLDMVL